jgi:UDP-glucose 4-epimerase
MRRAAVTGGAGFIGSHLVQELVRRGYHVTIVDNLLTGKLANIQSLIDRGKADFINGSITDLSLLKEAFQGAEFIFHQAAIPSVPRSIDDPLSSHEANATGTLKVLLTARDCGVKKVVYASSSSVYGDTPMLPKREDMTPNPLSPYAVAKLAGENYCQVFREVYGLPTVSLRYFNVYGLRQDPESPYAAVIPKFVSRIKSGQPPVIYGDGLQTRDFTFVGDAVAANILAAEGDACGVFNVATGSRIAINELAHLVTDLMGSAIAPVHAAERPGDIRHSLADISRARSFGYAPRHDIRSGLAETLRGDGA